MNINKAIICGRITKDPDMRTTPNGTSLCTFGVATNRVWMTDGKKNEEIEFHSVLAWGKTAETISQYFKKGDEIYVEGRNKTDHWKDKDDKSHQRTQIIVESFQFGQKSKANQGESYKKKEPEYDNQSEEAVQRDNYGGRDDETEIRIEDIPF